MAVKLKKKYEKKTEIPAELVTLYKEVEGEFVLDIEAEGFAGEDNVTRLQTSLNKERLDHKATKDKLAKFGEINPDTLHTDLDELGELRAAREAGGGTPDEKKIAELVEAGVKRRIGPVERERDQLKAKSEKVEKENGELQGTIKKSKVHDAVRGVAATQKVVATALDDVLMQAERIFEVTESGEVITRDGVGVTPGLKAEQWLSDMK